MSSPSAAGGLHREVTLGLERQHGNHGREVSYESGGAIARILNRV